MYQKLRLPSENLVCTIYNGRNLQLEILISSYALEMQVLRPYKEYQQVTSIANLYRKNLQTTTLISLISTHTTHNHTSFASRLYFVVLNTNNLKDTRTWWGQMSWLFYSGHACMRMRWTLGCENIKKLTFPKHFYNVFILKPVIVISVTIWKQFAITLWKCFDVNTIDASKG